MLVAPVPFITSTAVRVGVRNTGGEAAIHLREAKLLGSFSVRSICVM